MRISDIMTREVCLVNPSQKLCEAAAEMEKNDIGVLPVGENDRLVGMITDRDIAVRGISHGLGPDTPVRDVMSSGDVLYCYDDEDIDDIAQNMADQQIRRMPVLNRDKRLVGIVSLGDLAVSPEADAELALSGISQSGGSHCQSASA